MEKKTIDALELVRNNYRDYSVYVSSGRSYPSIIDGLKSSYRRALYGMHENRSSKIVKVAELAAHALPYHPHPSSVAGVIVQMGEAGNKLKMIDTQGNWGDSSRGVAASAERYIGGRLSGLAERLLLDSVEHSSFIKGEIEKDEPEALPVLLPYCFINGMSGIPSGLPALNIPTLNIIDMIDYYLEILSHKNIDHLPKKYPDPNLGIDILSSRKEWEDILRVGKGVLKVAPRMTIENGVIRITALPSGKTTDHIRKIIEKEILLEKVDLRDESTDVVSFVVERVPHKQCDMQEIFNRLYSKLQANMSYNMAFYDKDKIYVPCGFNRVVQANIRYLMETHNRKLTEDLLQAKTRLTVLMIIEGLKKKNLVKSLFELDYDGAVQFLIKHFKCTDNDASKVLQKPISYLTKEHSKEIEDLEAEIEILESNKKNIFDYLIEKYQSLKKEIGSIVKGKFAPTVFMSETKPKRSKQTSTKPAAKGSDQKSSRKSANKKAVSTKKTSSAKSAAKLSDTKSNKQSTGKSKAKTSSKTPHNIKAKALKKKGNKT